MALFDFIKKITDALDKNVNNIDNNIDLRNAFDTMNHDIVMKRLEYNGIRGVVSEWIKSYLSNKNKFVQVDNVHSDYKDVTCGIPQGSIL